MSRLQEVKKVTKEWLSENINILKQENISLEVLIDNENCLRILLETKDKMGEILVEEPSIEDYKVILDNGMVLM